MDEVLKDARTTRRSSGWSKKGKQAEKNQVFVQGRRTSTEALLTLDRIVIAMVVEGSMTKAGFIEYLELVVVSFSYIHIAYMSCNPITDAVMFCISWTTFCPCHGKIHHGNAILELADRFSILCNISALFLIYLMVFICTGVRIEYLPPYSPDLNPIKEAFSKIKHFIHHHNSYYNTITGDGILFDMYKVMDIIMPDDSDGYFIHAGYF